MLVKDVLVRPLITEKSSSRLAERTYAFEVVDTAAKPDIHRAIEQFFGVQVEDVRTLIVRGKTKRFGRFFGKRRNWKKAYVTLAAGHSLNFFGT
jgi:large subunit ribosomal protein L23